jgi:FkbM family methyltransferase
MQIRENPAHRLEEKSQGEVLPSRWRRRLRSRLAAKPVLEPFPGWWVGAGQSDGVATRVRKIAWRWLRDPFEVTWFDGWRLSLYPGNEISKSVFVTGRYEPNEFYLLSKVLKAGMTFIDVGANMGLYTLFAAGRVGETGCVVSIEPSRREMEMVRTEVERNGLRNVRLLPVALSDRRSEVELLVAPLEKSGHNTLGAFGFAGTALDHRERVQTVRLDDLLQSEGLSRVDVIKMDIEGAEQAALLGAAETIEKHRPILFIELSDRSLQHQQASSQEVLAILARQGYRVYGYEPSTGLPARRAGNVSGAENVVAVHGDSTPW